MTQQQDPSEIARIFDADIAPGDATALAELGPRYNVAPTQPLTVVVQREAGRQVEVHRWGLVPAWSERPQARAPLINARAETIATSPSFRTSFMRRRCIVPADGFYEWLRDGRKRLPFLVRPTTSAAASTGGLLAFAGIWSPWRDPNGEWLLTSAVVTTAANATVGRLHNRMPVILGPDELALWLDPTMADAGLLASLLQPAADDLLELVAVSARVNNANNEGADLIAPIGAVAEAGPPLTLFG